MSVEICATVLFSLRKFVSWAFLKLVFGVFVAVAGLTIHALWLFQHDDPDFPAVHARLIVDLKAKQAAVQIARDNDRNELAVFEGEFAADRDRAARAAAIAENLRSLQSWWEKLFGNREQQRLNASRIEDLKRIERESLDAANQLQRNLILGTNAVEARERELRKINSRLELAETTDSRVVHYLYASWQHGKWFVLAWLCLYFFGPTVHKLILFYYVAPRLARGRPLLLSGATAPFPLLGKSSSVVETSLWPGETARVRKRYLLAVDDEVDQKPRFLLSWRFPLTSLLSGCVHDVNLRNARAGRDYRLAFAHHKIRENQMAVVHVPEGGSLVVRPSFLAGVILPPGEKLGLRRRWQFFRWQAWLTGQFCFLEFSGPCRLIVAGRPGLRAERLAADEEGTPPECRTSLDRIVGFTPSLEYRLIRTTRFWQYYRRRALLFDASFVGVGFVLIQTCLPGFSPGLWSATRSRARKLIGL